MKIRDTLYCSILLFMCNMGGTVGLLTHGNSVNVTDTINGFPGHNVDLADMMQLLLNQTAEIENLKQQTAEIENLKQQTAEIEHLKQKTAEIENLNQQTANDRSTIQSLQNRVFFLEAELNKLNVSKLPSSQEFSTYLKSMNQLTQNLAANEASDKNISQRLYNAVQTLEDLKLKDMSTTQLLLNQSGELKQQSANDRYSIHLLQNETQRLLKTTQLLLNQSEELKQDSETDKSFIHLLQNETKRLVKNLDDLKVQVRYTSLSLLDVHSMTEELNGSLTQRLEERINNVHDHIASKYNNKLKLLHKSSIVISYAFLALPITLHYFFLKCCSFLDYRYNCIRIILSH